MPSLARAEAQQRAALLTVHKYSLELELSEHEPRFRSQTTIRFDCAVPGASTFLDVRPAALEWVELNDEPLDPATLTDGRLPLDDLRAENVLRLSALMDYSSDGEGMHRHVDPIDQCSYLYAMSFLDAAPRWFACFDQPDLKATYDLTVHCPPGWTVIGNGAASRIADGHWRLAVTEPLATYFVTLVAGPYHSIIAEHDGIRLGLHARASLAEYLAAEAPGMFAITRAAFDRYHEMFGIRYPFGEYHQAFVADFNAGAMENPGCVTLREQYVFRSAMTAAERNRRAATIAHELAHMWFGNLVTMRWWDDLWLNESFAEYLGYRTCSEVGGYPGLAELAELAWADFGIERKAIGYVADQSPSTHPVAGNGAEDAAAALAAFDGISYSKGASALRQLAEHLGDEVFFAGLRTYFDRHRFGNAELADLIDAWTDAGGEDLDDWVCQWLQTSGLDTLHASVSDGWLDIRQGSPGATRRPHTIRVAGFDPAGGNLLDEQVRLAGEPVRLPVPTGLRLAVADSLDQTWAKIRFAAADGSGWELLADLLPRISQNQTRVVLYNAIRDEVRDGGLDPDVALDVLLTVYPLEPIESINNEMLGFAVNELAAGYAASADRASRRSRIVRTAEHVLERAEAGSDRQLGAARVLVSACDEVELLEVWRRGRQLPRGLRIDPELRWAIACRLASLGQLADADIDDELLVDDSSAGMVHAARARALRPDPAAKQRAWTLLTTAGTTPAYELYATAEGFFDPTQPAASEPYLSRFFTEMPATAAHRRGWALGKVIRSAFPVAVGDQQTLSLAERTLTRTDLGPAVRRSLTDGTDAMRRCLSSVQRYHRSRAVEVGVTAAR
ncbi:MAG TPA: aminopeptidase N [Jatrophihabitans sp.]|nr:aminopeptidase N [Jatrophihabitans sp.]